VALGDSFTEGLYDVAPDGSHRGWADRVAQRLAGLTPDFRYANLAVRGRLLRQIVDEQVPVALQMRPALVSFCGGANDVLRRRANMGDLARRFEEAVAALRASGADVLLFTLGQPSRRHRAARGLDRRFAALNAIVEQVAGSYGCLLIPTGEAEIFDDHRVWCDDRLHLNAEGHARVAGAVLEYLGLGDAAWRKPLSPALRPKPLGQILLGDLMWTRRHYAPWVYRRLRGISTGHEVLPKRPILQRLVEPLDEVFGDGLGGGTVAGGVGGGLSGALGDALGGGLGGGLSGALGDALGGGLGGGLSAALGDAFGDALAGGADPAVADG
jgi:lysophospholipase L1-like esterase